MQRCGNQLRGWERSSSSFTLSARFHTSSATQTLASRSAMVNINRNASHAEPKHKSRQVAGSRARSTACTVSRKRDEGEQKPRSRKGRMFEHEKRRRGRPASMRSPDDSPLRDGNRDRLVGLLTERATKTLLCYLSETNPNVYHWLTIYLKENPIPLNGNWDEVSGEDFLRKLLTMPLSMAKFDVGRDPMFDHVVACGVDPRSIAQRIMDIRAELAREFIQDLSDIKEENSILLRETLATSLSITPAFVIPTQADGSTHPDFVHPDFVPSEMDKKTEGDWDLPPSQPKPTA